jgi:hypothetical protein
MVNLPGELGEPLADEYYPTEDGYQASPSGNYSYESTPPLYTQIVSDTLYVEPRPRFRFWPFLIGFLSVLAVFLLLSLLWLYIFSPNIISSWSLFGGASVDVPSLGVEIDRENALRSQLAILEAQYNEKLAACVVPQAAPEQVPEPDPLPDPLPVVPDEPVSEPPEPMDDLVIPDQSIDKKDLSFLEGCWDSGSDLINSNTGLPVVTKYCFDNSGNAIVTVDEKDKNGKIIGVCSTTGKARFEDGNLVIDDRGAVCPYNNSRYNKAKIICVPMDDGRVDCSIIQKDSTAHAKMSRSSR